MTKIVGILNITPDSFSDGGRYNSAETSLKQAKSLIIEGADMIDVGAESTRPGAIAISCEEEMSRVKDSLPQIVDYVNEYNLENSTDIETSIDSYHFETIKFAYELGVDVINDVTGLKDEEIVDFIAKNNIKTVLMHNLKVESDPNIIINSGMGAAAKVYNWGVRKISSLQKKGVKKSQLIFDPGIGFGKNAQQNINILKNIAIYHDLGVPIYVGHSKKRFLSEVFKKLDENGDEKEVLRAKSMKTAAISAFLAKRGVGYIRVHDVLLNREVMKGGLV